jgi:hypothetical protein
MLREIVQCRLENAEITVPVERVIPDRQPLCGSLALERREFRADATE